MRYLRVARRLRQVLLHVWSWLAMYLSLPLALARRGRSFIFAQHLGSCSLDGARRVAVFVHFDAYGLVHDYVLFYLSAIREAGFEVVFVSNAPNLQADAVARLRPLVGVVLLRRNVGYDFTGYRDGLRWLGDTSRFDQVLLANDSVYGPLFDLAEAVRRCDGSADVWGITDSWSHRYHLQSYFLLLQRSALTHPVLENFWHQMMPSQSKRWIIERCEIGFSQAVLKAGLRISALCSYRHATADLQNLIASGALQAGSVDREARRYLLQLLKRVQAGVPLNPTHHFFDYMIAQKHILFIKRELVSRNPGNVPYAYAWENLIHSVSNYDTRMVVRHLQAIARDHAP